jgi:hypothetical protein
VSAYLKVSSEVGDDLVISGFGEVIIHPFQEQLFWWQAHRITTQFCHFLEQTILYIPRTVRWSTLESREKEKYIEKERKKK